MRTDRSTFRHPAAPAKRAPLLRDRADFGRFPAARLIFTPTAPAITRGRDALLDRGPRRPPARRGAGAREVLGATRVSRVLAPPPAARGTDDPVRRLHALDDHLGRVRA